MSTYLYGAFDYVLVMTRTRFRVNPHSENTRGVLDDEDGNIHGIFCLLPSSLMTREIEVADCNHSYYTV